uniref:8.1 kDa putative secretory protein n=1 Tax=Argas monolakensis TaxID=34602 RepID=Q09JT2_ARGMO|nr:8.1 kDa putative secretory protein [Argas monolakensis]
MRGILGVTLAVLFTASVLCIRAADGGPSGPRISPRDASPQTSRCGQQACSGANQCATGCSCQAPSYNIIQTQARCVQNS